MTSCGERPEAQYPVAALHRCNPVRQPAEAKRRRRGAVAAAALPCRAADHALEPAFARQAVLTVKLLSGLGVSGDAFRRDFEALQAAYRQAEASSDSRGALSAANKLDELNSRIADFGLKELK